MIESTSQHDDNTALRRARIELDDGKGVGGCGSGKLQNTIALCIIFQMVIVNMVFWNNHHSGRYFEESVQLIPHESFEQSGRLRRKLSESRPERFDDEWGLQEENHLLRDVLQDVLLRGGTPEPVKVHPQRETIAGLRQSLLQMLDSKSAPVADVPAPALETLAGQPQQQQIVLPQQQQPVALNQVPVVATATTSAAPPAVPVKKRRFIIHPGPEKTGTTTIQHALYDLIDAGTLSKDRWFGIGWFAKPPQKDRKNKVIPYNGLDIQDCHGTAEEFLEKFREQIGNLWDRNVDVVFSMEHLTPLIAANPDLVASMKDILDPIFETEILIGYRPYFEWMLSFWSQGNKRIPEEYPTKADYPWKRPNGDMFQVNPMYPGFYGWITNQQYFTKDLMELWSPYFKVSIIDM
jgi:hypothetical protein